MAGVFGFSALANSTATQNPVINAPVVQNASARAGWALPGLNKLEINFFNSSQSRFQNIDAVLNGLGPRYNGVSCASCHAQPAIGGSSPAQNPQIAMASMEGAQNNLPSFINLNGPVRVARFVKNSDGSLDGGVHDLFVITGRHDAPGCQIRQPDFDAQLASNNVVFRIPTPLFGLGLVENVSEATLKNALAANATLKAQAGIKGHFNINGNDGTITRFGWKAQNKSLLMFAGEAYNVESGVTNDLFPNERETNPNCQYNHQPEDTADLTGLINSGSPASDYSNDIVNFAAFSRLLAAPQPAPPTATSVNGKAIFNTVGCQLCHTATLVTEKSTYSAQSNISFNPYSDFAVHGMGSALADGITQGTANGQEYRTAPLWGVGQRLYFLHDGRTSDLLQAINQHASPGSEANAVIKKFNLLTLKDQQSLLGFLLSL
jgi:CxxC motif-containing protein (DUF1111 family)